MDQGALFYRFSLDRHVPADHLPRAIDRFVDLGDLRVRLAPFYSSTGRPAIDPAMKATRIEKRSLALQNQAGSRSIFQQGARSVADHKGSDSGSAEKVEGRLSTWLAQGLGGAAPADEIHETHAAAIYLVGDRAYKIKKPVRFGYLDFSTVEKRGEALRRELERNRASAPDMYLAVHEIRRRPDGSFTLGREGDLAEYVLEMRRFDGDALLSRHPQELQGDLAEELGRSIARFHASAPQLTKLSGAASFAYGLDTNSRELFAYESVLGRETVRRLAGGLSDAFPAAAQLLDDRFDYGFGRRCHGDLHLGNIFLRGGAPVLFDCIEFDDRLSDIDVLYDLAFLLMDVQVDGTREAANRIFNGYLDEAARHFGSEMWTGLRLMPLFLSSRAAVRAHVSARMGKPDRARAYAAAALQFLVPRKAELIAVGGLSGSGKTVFARALAPSLGAAPGAVVLRSDEIRKRLWNVAAKTRLPPSAYTADAGVQVYGEMLHLAQNILRGGQAVVLDAVFQRESERDSCRALAGQCGVGFAGIWLDAATDILRKRVAGRRNDASDADLSVLEEQLTRDPGRLDWDRVDASGDLAARACELVARPA